MSHSSSVSHIGSLLTVNWLSVLMILILSQISGTKYPVIITEVI